MDFLQLLEEDHQTASADALAAAPPVDALAVQLAAPDLAPAEVGNDKGRPRPKLKGREWSYYCHTKKAAERRERSFTECSQVLDHLRPKRPNTKLIIGKGKKVRDPLRQLRVVALAGGTSQGDRDSPAPRHDAFSCLRAAFGTAANVSHAALVLHCARKTIQRMSGGGRIHSFYPAPHAL